MTGYFVRARVDGRWDSVELDELPDGALAEWADALDETRARGWLAALWRWAREHDVGPEFAAVGDGALSELSAGLRPEAIRRGVAEVVRAIRERYRPARRHRPGDVDEGPPRAVP